MSKSLLKQSIVALSASLLIGAASIPTYVQANEDPIATVGEHQITKDEFYEAMKKVAGPVTLRTLILETILEANADNPEELKKSAEEEVNEQIEQAGGEDVFKQLLVSQKLGTIEEYRYQVYVRNLFQNVVEKNIDLSDEAIKAYYDEGYAPMMEAQHILVETEEEALEAIQRINDGEEFDAVAREISKDGTASNGGLLQPFKTGQMVSEFEEAVKGLENGKMTETPVKSQFGYHVIKAINNGEKKPFEEVKEEVKEQYIVSKFSDTQFSYKIIGQLLVDTGYEIKDEDLKDAVSDLIELTKEPEEKVENSDESKEETETEAAEEEQEEAESEENEASE
ncbi:peptidylprolyl isomerase [Falseniella ignava]|uniref:Foldase protein PrsA n=2 Tax=Falseniella ignava TaxID=137730 RepID=K1LM53_9LACT|nr:peptidylprolyl isomerase [Falseniella ignava]EKB57905.1 hypothetical protein HMPREF9707_00365 [Falseniella ignava CCUG 37419]PKY89118.1 peptidylprolyl isomerase [Falseniella ignava]